MNQLNNCIAIGVKDMNAVTGRFCAHLGGTVTATTTTYVEVSAGPFRFYFVEDGTNDIAFSVTVENEEIALKELLDAGYTDVPELRERSGEHFVRDPDGILINLFQEPVPSNDK